MNPTSPFLLIATLAAASTVIPAPAGPSAPAPLSVPASQAAPTGWEPLWSLASLYKNDANPILQEFKLRGRYQGQYHWLESDQGGSDAWENRRSRFGFDAKLFRKKIGIRLDVQSNDAFDPFYDRLTDATIRWKPSEKFSLTLGKQKPQIAYFDWLQSNVYQPTFERSNIFTQLRVDRASGAVAEGEVDRFTWQAGLYSNDMDREFGSFDGGVSFGAGIGYDFKESLGLEKADWRLDWLRSDIEDGDTVLYRYQNIISSTVWLKDGRWSVVGESFLGTGEAPDVFGFFIQPTYDIVPKKFQAVARYSFTTGDGPDSVAAQRRYEREAPLLTGGGKGETYQAVYLGGQYFINGDRLKLMAGAEYAYLDGGGNGGDFDGITFLTGIRFSF